MPLRERRAIRETGGDAELEVQEWFCDGAQVQVRFSDGGKSINERGYFDAREMLKWIEHVRGMCLVVIREEGRERRRFRKAEAQLDCAREES